jgi:Xaa-Pro dipeptidase
MNEMPAARPRALSWDELKTRLDNGPAFNAMRNTPYFRDAAYEHFSPAEYARRYKALRAKMKAERIDCMIAPGGPSHWSFGGAMLWLSGHWEWHSLAAYVVVPLDGEPTLVYAMGGTHIEAVRQETAAALKDVRSSRGGRFAEVMAERIKELKLERGRIGLMEIDARHGDYMPVNQFNALNSALPGAEFVFTEGWLHELLSVHSAEELLCIHKAGILCERAMRAMVARAAPGVSEAELRAAAGAAILEGGGDIDFLIIGATSGANPALVFGNPRPSNRLLADGDVITMELAAGYRGYSAQLGWPICVGEPAESVRKFFAEIALPGFERIVAEIGPGRPVEGMRKAAQFFREKGAQSRPIHVHGIDLITDGPHVFQDHVEAEPFEQVMKPGMVIMAEPTPITPDGMFGMFLGHTFIVTGDGYQCCDALPWELLVAG